MNIKRFYTANGEQEFLLKSYDGCEVPVGYSYEDDLQTRWECLRDLMNNSVFPIIYRLIDIEIPKYFYLHKNTLSSRVCAGQSVNIVDAKSLKEALRIVNSENNWHDSLNLDFFINIEFEAAHEYQQTKKYGCQLYITHGLETIQDVEDEEDFPIYYLYFGDEKTIIDIPFTTDQEDKIIGHFLGYLWQSEQDKESI
ncbi:MAG: hypothetical protein KDD32_03575 [Bacteroidetes bacterium]|nr:hypothetical protein [Bacteroidota bacterium]